MANLTSGKITFQRLPQNVGWRKVVRRLTSKVTNSLTNSVYIQTRASCPAVFALHKWNGSMCHWEDPISTTRYVGSRKCRRAAAWNPSSRLLLYNAITVPRVVTDFKLQQSRRSLFARHYHCTFPVSFTALRLLCCSVKIITMKISHLVTNRLLKQTG